MDTQPSSSWRILQIDDDEDDYLLTRAMLAEMREPKVEIDWAANYEEGRSKLRDSSYDAVLVDYDLGLETGLKIIEDFSATYPAPLILYTGRGSRVVDREALQAGATLYLTKDEVNPLLLERGIRYAIQLKQRETDLLEANRRLEQELAERKRAEAALRASENKFSLFFDRSAFPSAVFRLPEGVLAEVNEAWVATFGFAREDAIGKSADELGMHLDAETRARLSTQLMAHGSVRRVETSLCLRSGEQRDFLLNLDLVEFDGQQYTINTMEDITARKQVERALAVSEARWREFLDSTHDNFIGLDHEWRFTYANRHYGELMGVNPERLIGKNYWELFPQYLGTELERNYREVMRSGKALHYRQGGVYTRSVYDVSLYPTSEGLAIFSIDRTDEFHSQRELEDERVRLQDLLRALPVAVWIVDPRGKVLVKNEQADRIWGGPAPLAENVAAYREYVAWFVDSGEMVGPEQYPVAQALRTGEPVPPVELRIRRFDGSEGIVLATGAPIKDRDGRLAGAVAINVDLSGRYQDRQALSVSEQKYRDLAETVQLERNKLAAVIEELPVGVGVADTRGTTLSLNREGLRLHGFASETEMYAQLEYYREAFQLLRPDGNLLPQEEWPAVRALRGDYVQDLVVILHNRRKDIRHTVAYSATPVLDNTGKVSLTIYTIQDLTERRQADQALRESEANFRRLADAMPQLVWTATPDGSVDYYNQRYRLYTGIDLAEGGKWEWAPVLHPDDLQPTVAAWKQAVESGEVYQIEHRVQMADGSYRWHLSRGIPVLDKYQRVARWYGTATDIHDYKLAEQELRESYQELERSNQALQEFTAIASHDLQEPLHKMKAFGELLANRYSSVLEGDGRDYIARISSAANRMTSMIQALLAYSQVTSRAAEFTRVDLNEVVAGVLSDLEIRIAETGAFVQVGALPVLEADPLQMRQLFQNLIGNALKYRRPGTAPRIEITAARKNGGWLIRIQDNGIGIEARTVQHIFEPFVRGHPRGAHEGTGMGLAICKKIVERHGGMILVESQPGTGSAFMVTLPATPKIVER